ncbi:hypothetical protein SAY86_002640 [Trapa natans]|uniref:Uncharacterized protein n=1 Tax=Trapa natans TaxID=22666 RepID=A0AAN7LGA1_TRANT|nr:hypothetical protein SAY86_002640 [Trapa natans]
MDAEFWSSRLHSSQNNLLPYKHLISPQDGSHVAGSFWLPETPAKTVPLRSHTIPIHQSENLLDMLNCPELGAPSSNVYLHEIPGCSNYVQQTNQYERMASTEEFFGLDFDFLERNHQTTNQSTGAYTLDWALVTLQQDLCLCTISWLWEI